VVLALPGTDLRGGVESLANAVLGWKGEPAVLQVLVEGPRGTGKSRQIMALLRAFCESFPGCRGYIIRNKRASMGGTTLVEWEKALGPGHPALRGADKSKRAFYRFPNGSEVWLAGLDEDERLKSSSLDWIYYEEGTESPTGSKWDTLVGCMRSWVMPVQVMITSTNPKHPGHWLNKRADIGTISRIKTRFQDNPVWYEADLVTPTAQGKAFIDSLSQLTGHKRRRDYEGVWSAAEGTVFDEFDESVHLIDAQIVKNLKGDFVQSDRWPGRLIPINWYGIGMDFGWSAPGVLQVWACNDRQDLRFRVAEVYQTGWQLDQWAEAIAALHAEFNISWGVADSAEPRTIDFLNDRCRLFHQRRDEPFIRPADKANGKLWGLDQLHWGFSSRSGGPRTFLFKNALRYGADPSLVNEGVATCFEEELPNYMWDEKVAHRDRPDKLCACHAIDAAIYFHIASWQRREAMLREETIFKPGTISHWLRDYEILGMDWRPDRVGA